MTPIANTSRKRGPHNAAMLALRLTLAAVLIGWLIYSGRLDLKLLTSLHFGPSLVALIFLEALQMLIPLARWFILVRARRLRLGPGGALHVGLIGSFVTVCIPATLGLDGAKIYYGSRLNKGREHDMLSTVLLDRAIGVAALMVLTLAFGYALLLRQFSLTLQKTLSFVGALLVAAVLLSPILFSKRPVLLLERFRIGRVAAPTLRAISDYRRQKGVLASAFLLSCFGHLANFSGAYLAFQCLGISVPTLAVFAILPVVTLSGIIPLTPLGIGVTDSVAVTLFTAVGVRGGAETTTVLRCVIVLLSVLCLPAYLIPFAEEQQSEEQYYRVTRFPEPCGQELRAAETPHARAAISAADLNT